MATFYDVRLPGTLAGGASSEVFPVSFVTSDLGIPSFDLILMSADSVELHRQTYPGPYEVAGHVMFMSTFESGDFDGDWDLSDGTFVNVYLSPPGEAHDHAGSGVLGSIAYRSFGKDFSISDDEKARKLVSWDQVRLPKADLKPASSDYLASADGSVSLREAMSSFSRALKSVTGNFDDNFNMESSVFQVDEGNGFMLKGDHAFSGEAGLVRVKDDIKLGRGLVDDELQLARVVKTFTGESLAAVYNGHRTAEAATPGSGALASIEAYLVGQGASLAQWALYSIVPEWGLDGDGDMVEGGTLPGGNGTGDLLPSEEAVIDTFSAYAWGLSSVSEFDASVVSLADRLVLDGGGDWERLLDSEVAKANLSPYGISFAGMMRDLNDMALSGGGSQPMEDLSDVFTGSEDGVGKAEGDVLMYRSGGAAGAGWYAEALPADAVGATDLPGLSDVASGLVVNHADSDGKLLGVVYNAADDKHEVNLMDGPVGVTQLMDLTDVDDALTPTPGQMLVWDDGAGKFVAQDVPSGGGAASFPDLSDVDATIVIDDVANDGKMLGVVESSATPGTYHIALLDAPAPGDGGGDHVEYRRVEELTGVASVLDADAVTHILDFQSVTEQAINSQTNVFKDFLEIYVNGLLVAPSKFDLEHANLDDRKIGFTFPIGSDDEVVVSIQKDPTS